MLVVLLILRTTGVNRRTTRTVARFADVFLWSVGGAAPTLMVLVVLVVSGVPPYAGILTDLRGLLRFLMG